jgi:pimeloyl-ACP methyl ester carboxylesterase
LESEIRYQNRRIAFAEYGDPAGKPVFLCHGTPSSRLNRPDDETTRALGARLIVIDRPGCGLSCINVLDVEEGLEHRTV